ncbi:unnamed protein product [Moneuplotes crassus]|uniref:Uncharacterized protein n=1 Tax=Euplotes crassus TaxID=5936 RepID=A0AAD1Y7U1_EUPCR|nr:unnamed protein product [Moneuplotes crassus]
MRKGSIVKREISCTPTPQPVGAEIIQLKHSDSRAKRRDKLTHKNSKIKIIGNPKIKINRHLKKSEGSRVKLSDCIKFKHNHNFDSLYNNSQTIYKEVIEKSLFSMSAQKSQTNSNHKLAESPCSGGNLRGSKYPSQPKQNNKKIKASKPPIDAKMRISKMIEKINLTTKSEKMSELTRKSTDPKAKKHNKEDIRTIIIDKFFNKEIDEESSRMAKDSFIQGHLDRVEDRKHKSKFDKVMIKDIMHNEFMVDKYKPPKSGFKKKEYSTKRIKLKALRSIDKTLTSLHKRIQRSLDNRSMVFTSSKNNLKISNSSTNGNSFPNIVDDSLCCKNIFTSNQSLSSITVKTSNANPLNMFRDNSETLSTHLPPNYPLPASNEHNFLKSTFCKSLTRFKAPMTQPHVKRRSAFSRYKNATLEKSSQKCQNPSNSPYFSKFLKMDKDQKSAIFRRRTPSISKSIPLPKSLHRLMKLE